MSNDELALLGRAGQGPLRLYHLYRLVIGLSLVLLISSSLENQLFNVAHSRLFSLGSWSYLIINILISLVMPRAERLAPLFALAMLDILLLSLLYFAAGGTPSGIGNLIVVAVAVANLLLYHNIGLLIAATGATGIIYLTFYLSLSHPEVSSQFTQAGILGALCFVAALAVQALGRKLQTSEKMLRQQSTTVASLEALNAAIIQRMRTGVLVLDSEFRVLQYNQSALNMLESRNLKRKNLQEYFPPLVEAYLNWQKNPSIAPATLQFSARSPQLQPGFVAHLQDNKQQLLVFLEDTRFYNQQAQQLKLASLGRLTASIAHEIRNPLGAISHAAQLLGESDSLDRADQRLGQIIQQQSRRLNHVIENVLQLSRQQKPEPQLLDLKQALYRYVNAYRDSAPADQVLKLEVTGKHLETRIDPYQLDQVLDNLVANAMRHTSVENGQRKVEIHLFHHPRLLLPVVEVCDSGPGVPADEEDVLFEPFHTTEKSGTGLGLYICRELCEINRARLDYVQRPAQGACFRITFAHPKSLGLNK